MPQSSHCLEANPSMLRNGVLVECSLTDGHNGVHITADRRSRWWGAKLTAVEQELARALRLHLAAHVIGDRRAAVDAQDYPKRPLLAAAGA